MSRDIDAELREIQRDLQSVVDRMRAPDAPDAQRLQATARDLQSVVDQLGRRPISKAQVEECARKVQSAIDQLQAGASLNAKHKATVDDLQEIKRRLQSAVARMA
ncbi:hypothetical protein ERJ75_000110400 [Trypanosoma vivax]|nr:hypothetical protein ERJ75_001050400 [Trypanosoma vivax]KAH8610760.1 hypothetical protein ERJ75_001050300 [Trypanosoma vivax]KAH8610782.1 hypothetical protein ERJ75_001048800 [Trypanosoma vivax]KAH8610783.1 hypothetical protein ERJ75_001048600 [Trypanosoma vivax]KAH8610789.1 hypothetical protein ERJ75_001050700 [Trypanosoma vivax]